MENFFSRCRDFYVTAARKRFPINDVTIKQLQVLNPSCARAEFLSLSPLAQKFPNWVNDGNVTNVQQLDDEWKRMAFTELPFDYNGMVIDEFWAKVGALTDGTEQQQFPNLSAFSYERRHTRL